MTTPLPESLRPRWWRHELVRLPVAVAVVVGYLTVWSSTTPSSTFHVLGHPVSERLSLAGVTAVVAVVLLPHLSYRPRDVLMLVVPLYNVVVAVKWLHRAQLLPRRAWVPRSDELPRAVRLPGGHGQYFLARDFGEAEHWRTRWCRNPTHHHPYATWEQAQAVGCLQDGTRHELADRER